MKKTIILLLILIILLPACTKKESKNAELTVFAAASLTETVTKIAEIYMKENPKVKVNVNLDSSGTLKKQIQQGAYCDVFISASQKQMNSLDISKDEKLNPERLDFIDTDTRIDILENKLVLVVPERNIKNINSFDDLSRLLLQASILLGIGNSDVPVGQYASKVLSYLNLNEEEIAKKGAITYGTTVKEVALQVKENSVDCGMVYCTDAFSARLNIVDTATPEMCGQVVYPVAIIKNSKNKELSKQFIQFIQNNKSKEIFKHVGFTPYL